MAAKPITSFRGDYSFLSNFYPCLVRWGSFDFTSVEHAYQASKNPTDLDFVKRVKRARSPGEAKHEGRRCRNPRSDWEDVKLDIMRGLLRKKFQIPALRLQLLATDDAELIEGNNWGDTYWGVCKGVGDNNLGKLLMEIRWEARTTRTS